MIYERKFGSGHGGDRKSSRNNCDLNAERFTLATATAAEESAYILRRKAIWEEINSTKTGGQNLATSLPDGRAKGPQHHKQFAAEVAQITGESKRGVNQKALGHGNFLPWIEAEFGMSDRTARSLISVYERLGSKMEMISDLAPTAIYALAAPSTPEPVREAVLERAGKVD